MKRPEKVAVITFKNGDQVAFWSHGGEMETFKMIWTAKADPRGYACLVIRDRADYERDPYAGTPQVFRGRRMMAREAG
jgi:hypothetical protein